MEKVILDYSFSGVSWEGLERHLEEFLEKRSTLPFVQTLAEPWSEVIRGELEGMEVENIVIAGIGGSSLGTEAILRALLPFSYNSRGKRIFFFDNIDPERTHELMELLEPEKTAFIVVSKSGGTTETIINFLLLFDAAGRNKERFIIITDPEKGKLREMADKEGFISFPIPSSLGGRYSVLSSVGLVPLYLAGVDIDALIAGGMEGIELASLEPQKNPALISAYFLYHAYETGSPMQVILVYSEHLHPLGLWYRQLYSESLGKEGWGQTPVLDMGSVDQHSKLQLYLDGPDDKVYTFWKLKKARHDIEIPENPYLETEFSGRSLAEIYSFMGDSTELALVQEGRRTISFEIPEINERFLGQFITLLESQVWYISSMKGINPFDQPAVERMKRLAMEMILGKRKKGERRTT